MDIKKAIRAFEKDKTYFLRNHPELHLPLLKIAKGKRPDSWIMGMPVWVVFQIIDEQIALAPHGLLFISNKVSEDDWEKIAMHEKMEAELVSLGKTPEEAHKTARDRILKR